jgi:hypothetical protein
VGVEVPRAVVARVLEELHREKGGLGVLGPEAEVLVEATHLLVVQVHVEELPRVDRLREGVDEGEARHRLVGELGVEAEESRRSRVAMKPRAEPTVGR